jgi:tetratricopeptide (TPR) repeat protein
VCDFAGVKRLHDLYNRAVGKFPGDLELWFNYIHMAKKLKSYRRIGSIVARAIQLHPRNPNLWILAAAWEFEHHANTAAARKLMQRAVAMNREQGVLWTEWFKMEMAYVTKIRKRAELLQSQAGKEDIAVEPESEDKLKVELGSEDESMDDEAIELPGAEEEGFLNTSAEEKGMHHGIDLQDPLLQYRIAKLIFEEACSAFPQDLELRKLCLKYAIVSHDAKDVIELILQSIERDFIPHDVDGIVLHCTWRVQPDMGFMEPTNPAFPELVHDAMESLGTFLLQVEPSVCQVLRDSILAFLKRQIDQGQSHLHLYLKAQMQRHFVAYLQAASPAFQFPQDQFIGKASDVPQCGKAALSESNFLECLGVIRYVVSQEFDSTPLLEQIIALASQRFPSSIPILKFKLKQDPQFASQAITILVQSKVEAHHLIPMIIFTHTLGRTLAGDDSGSVANVISCQDALEQWKIIEAAPMASTRVDEVMALKAEFLQSVISVLAPDQVVLFRERYGFRMDVVGGPRSQILSRLFDPCVPPDF